MKPPLSALLIAPNAYMRDAILTGRQTGTIREGTRDYRAGQPVMLCCHLEPWVVMADIAEVHCCVVRALTKADCAAAGFKSPKEALRGLRRFYQDLTPTSPVTVIRWTNVRGKLVDERVLIDER